MIGTISMDGFAPMTKSKPKFCGKPMSIAAAGLLPWHASSALAGPQSIASSKNWGLIRRQKPIQ